jgi:YD repeat-containing protein
MLPRLILIALLIILAVMFARGQTSERITYDNNGRIATVTYLQGNQALRIRYDYDGRGNITRTRSEIVAGVSDNAPSTGPSVSVYPNPTSQRVVIDVPAAQGSNVMLTIRAADGRSVLQESVVAGANGMAQLDIDATSKGLGSGTYQVSIATAGVVTTTSFVLAR